MTTDTQKLPTKKNKDIVGALLLEKRKLAAELAFIEADWSAKVREAKSSAKDFTIKIDFDGLSFEDKRDELSKKVDALEKEIFKCAEAPDQMVFANMVQAP